MPELDELLNTSLLPAATSVDTDDKVILSQDGLIVTATTTQVATAGGVPGGYTTEQAQDAVGAMVNTTLVYVDATPSLGRAALTGDVTAPAGSNATTIAPLAVTTAKIALDAVTNAELANMAPNRIKGRVTTGTADPEDLTPANVRTIITSDSGGGTANFLNASGTFTAPAGGTSYTAEDAQDAVGAMVDATLVYNDATPNLGRAALTGDVTAPAGSNATTIANLAVTAAKIANDTITATQIATNAITATELADNAVDTAAIANLAVSSGKIADNAVTNTELNDMAQYRIKGRILSGTGDPADLLPADVRTVITSDSGGGTTNFLNASGGWTAPAGGGGADEEAYVYMTNTSGHYIATPDAAAFDITGDLCIVARIALEDWSPGVGGTIVSKRITGSASYSLLVHTNGRLRLNISSDGTTITTFDATAAIPSVTVGVAKWVGMAFTADNLASGKTASFWHSADGVTWTKIGADVTQATVWPGTFVGTQQLEIGGYDNGTVNSLIGKIFEVSVRNGCGAATTIGGTEVAHFVADEMASARMRDSLGVLWTLYGDAAGVSGGGGGNLDGLSDVVIGTAVGGEVIRYNGTNWVDSTLTAADVSFTPTGTIAATTVQAAIAEAAAEGGGGGGVADNTYADIVVTGTGTLWNIVANAVGTTEIANSAVTHAKFQDIATASVVGRVAASTGVTKALSKTELTTLVNTFTAALDGAVPAPTTATGLFLKDDGTWAAPAGGGGGSGDPLAADFIISGRMFGR